MNSAQAPWIMLGCALAVTACRPTGRLGLAPTAPVTPAAPVAEVDGRRGALEPPCVDPIAHAERMHGLLDASGQPIEAPATQVMDLDGDGASDWILAVDRDATTTRFEMYVRRPNGCGRYVGGARIYGGIVGTLGKTSHGLAMLEVVDPCGGQLACVHHELRYDGSGWTLGDRWTVPRVRARSR